MSIENLKSLELWIGLIGSIFVLASTIVIPRIISNKEKREEGLKGKLEAENRTIAPNNQSISVRMGERGMTTSVPVYLVEGGYEYKPFLFGIGSPLFFIVKCKNGKIFLDARFQSIDGTEIATMTDNQWRINPNNYFHFESKNSQLEVTDKDGMLFQIDFTDQYNILLRGILIDGLKVHIMTDIYQSRIIKKIDTPKELNPISIDELRNISSHIPRLGAKKSK